MSYIKIILNKLFSSFTKWFVFLFFCSMILFMLFVTAYYIPDRAVFRLKNLFDYLGIFISFIIISISLFMINKFQIKNYLLIIMYFIICILFILVVPLEPFSDMGKIYNIALEGLQGDLTYLSQYPNNLPIVLIFSFLLKIWPNMFIIKATQIICNIIIIHLTHKLAKKLFIDINDKFILLLFIFNIPTILYCNHIYSDVAATLFSVIALYYLLYYDSNERKSLHIIIISLSLLLSFLIRPSCIIYLIATVIYLISKNEKKFLICTVIAFILFYFFYNKLRTSIVPFSEKQLPIWSWIQMGLNKVTLGFQDGSHSVDWTFNDVLERIKNLGIMGCAILVLKKNFWMWTEGTYQADRYGFNPHNATFQYSTLYTKYFADTTLVFDLLNSIFRGYYFWIIILSALGFFFTDKNNKKVNMLLHIIIGFIIFYTIWEIKSRYIYSLYPIFMIFAAYGLDNLVKTIFNKSAIRERI